MGLRGEIFSSRVALQNRTYFFNVKENRMGDLYLNIVESKNKETGGFERQSLIVFADDLQQFLSGFDESLKILEKSVREKRKGGKSGSEGRTRKDQYDHEHDNEKPPYKKESFQKDRFPEKRNKFNNNKRSEQKFHGGENTKDKFKTFQKDFSKKDSQEKRRIVVRKKK